MSFAVVWYLMNYVFCSYLRRGLGWHFPKVVGFELFTSLVMAFISWQLFAACQRPSVWECSLHNDRILDNYFLSGVLVQSHLLLLAAAMVLIYKCFINRSVLIVWLNLTRLFMFMRWNVGCCNSLEIFVIRIELWITPYVWDNRLQTLYVWNFVGFPIFNPPMPCLSQTPFFRMLAANHCETTYEILY